MFMLWLQHFARIMECLGSGFEVFLFTNYKEKQMVTFWQQENHHWFTGHLNPSAKKPVFSRGQLKIMTISIKAIGLCTCQKGL